MLISTSWMAGVLTDIVETRRDSEIDVEEAFDRCSVGIYRYIVLRLGNDQRLADDLMQQLWLTVCQAKPSVPLSEIEYWLRGVAKNLIRDHWRRAKRRPQPMGLDDQLTARDFATQLDDELLPPEIVNREDIRSQVMLAVTQLDAAEQDLIIRHYIRGESFADIAEARGLTERAVEGRLYRARQQLKAKLVHLEEALQ